MADPTQNRLEELEEELRRVKRESFAAIATASRLSIDGGDEFAREGRELELWRENLDLKAALNANTEPGLRRLQEDFLAARSEVAQLKRALARLEPVFGSKTPEEALRG